MVESADTISRQVFFDSSVSQLMYYGSENDVATLDALKQLGNYVSAANNIESLYIYNISEGNVSYAIKDFGQGIETAENFFDWEVLNSIYLNSFVDNSPVVRKTAISEISPTAKNVYTFFLTDNKGSSNSPDGAIFLNFSADWLLNAIKSLDNYSQSLVFVIDKNGTVVSNNSAFPFLSNISDKEFAKNILSPEKNSGYYIDNVNGVKSFITFVSSGKLDWKFVRITPYSAITSDLNRIRIVSLLVYLIIFISGIIISILISKKIYKPYNFMLNKIDNLENKSKQNLKQEFLQSLLFNSDSISYATILQKFMEYGVKLEENKPLSLILYKVDRYCDLCANNNFNEMNLLKNKIIKIVTGTSLEYCTSEAVISNSDCIVLITNIDDTDILKSIGKKGREAVLDSLGISCSIIISSITFSPEYLCKLYKEASEASYYRLFKGHGCIINANEYAVMKNTEVVYPEMKVKQLQEAIMLGKTKDCSIIYGYSERVEKSLL
jgi:two-component system response regulator YesN